ncbi:MAG TPA: PilN domain-containing protein [Nitrospira sp.]|nr:PilN domain-containing protein [Nitrospira sp.]
MKLWRHSALFDRGWRRFRLTRAESRYLRLELGNQHRRYLKPARSGLALVSLILLGCIAWGIVHAVEVFSSRREMETRLELIRAQDRELLARLQQEGIDVSPPALQRLPAEVALANQLLAKRNFSWTQFLSGLEAAIPERVSIKSVRLDPGSAVIHLTGAAVTVEDVTTLALKFQDHPVFRDPVLGQHHTGADGLVEFDMSLKYKPQPA